ncbi:MAG: DNA polymerase III subunit [Methylocystaceae bacterium]
MQLAMVGGQPMVTNRLTEYLQGSQLSHAYLFWGPSGVGKLKTAKAFTADILAASHPQTPHLIASGQHPDYLLVQREGAAIRIDDIRNMEKWLYQKPYWAERKVVIINEAQYLNRESGNALLKTLEEPPAYAIIILVANSNALLPTIISRCQSIRFGALSTSYINEVLISAGTEPEIASLTAAMAEGSLTTAARLIPKGPQVLLEEARTLLINFGQGRAQFVVLQAEIMEKDNEYQQAFYAALRYVLLMASRDEEAEFKISPEQARQILIKMDEHRRLEKVNASRLLLSLEMLWQLFDVVKPA